MSNYGYLFNSAEILNKKEQIEQIKEIIAKADKQFGLQLIYVKGTLSMYRIKAKLSEYLTPNEFKEFYGIIETIRTIGYR